MRLLRNRFCSAAQPLQLARNRVAMLGIPPVDGDLLFGNDATGGQDKLVKQIIKGNDAYRL